MSKTEKCRWCKRIAVTVCKNTRDMDPEDGFNRDRVCHEILDGLGGGERGFRLPAPPPHPTA